LGRSHADSNQPANARELPLGAIGVIGAGSMRLRRILVPVDRSEPSAHAIDLSLRLAKHAGAEIVFCHAVDLTGAVTELTNPYAAAGVAPILGALEDESKSLLASASARATDSGVPSSTLALTGPPARAILDLLRDQSIDAVVMGTRGRRGASRFFLGSTAEGVIRDTEAPVFVIPPSAKLPVEGAQTFSRILVALDDSAPAQRALECALDLAEPGKTSIVIAHAVDISRIYETAAFHDNDRGVALGREWEAGRALLAMAQTRAKDCGIAAETVVVEGGPSDTMLELARTRHADLIALGTHGRRGLDKMLLGSVAEGVLRTAPVPVLVVRDRAERGAESPQ
jgi:nucleotide-binding universal stress UspA family protein